MASPVLIERIQNARFRTTRLGSGYDEEEVDTYLDKLVALLSGGGRLDAVELSFVRFSTTRLRPGYVKQDVDTFLGEIAQLAAG
jgi:DivIVA domain-containing protein